MKISGEAAFADQTAAVRFSTELSEIIQEEGYALERIFNANETGFFLERNAKQNVFVP